MTQDEMKNLKKIDLHCHLDGSLSEETIQKMAQNNGILLPEREELFQRLCAGDDCQDLKPGRSRAQPIKGCGKGKYSVHGNPVCSPFQRIRRAVL